MAHDADSGEFPPKRQHDTAGAKKPPRKAGDREVALTRRKLVGLLVAASGAAPAGALAQAALGNARVTQSAPPAQALAVRPNLQMVTPAPEGPLRANPSGALSQFALLRPDDFAYLTVRLVNLQVTGSGASRRIVRTGGKRPCLMVVNFPPQAIAEYVYPDTVPDAGTVVDREGGTDQSKAPPTVNTLPFKSGTVAQARIAGASRLAFVMPDSVDHVDFTARAVLDACNAWPLNLDVRATDAPADYAPAHDFDKIRVRLTAIAVQQQQSLEHHEPGITALLDRAAARVADAIAEMAGRGQALGDAAIDALIALEIKQTIDAKDLTDDERDNTSVILTGVARPASLYVGTVSTLLLSNVAAAALGAQVVNSEASGTPGAPANRMSPIPLAGLPGQTAAQAPSIRAQRATAAMQGVGNYMSAARAGLNFMIDTRPRPIADDATDIEVPYHLHLSPLSTAGFTHASNAVDHGTGLYDLWHTRMGTRIAEWTLSENPEPVRALWADDIVLKANGDYDTTVDMGSDWSLLAEDRADIVRLSSFDGTTRYGKYVSHPAMARHLRLTALGASMEVEGVWPDHLTLDSDLVAWKHITSIGRDQYVRVIYEGFLFPFGHAAALIKVSERKFSQQQDGGRVAGLMQKFFIVVRERVRSFPGDAQPHQGRDFPFVSVEIATRQTADLAKPAQAKGLKIGAGEVYPQAQDVYKAFWPKLIQAPNTDFTFHIIGTDSMGRRASFDMPLMFVAGSLNQESDVSGAGAANSAIGKIAAAYNTAAADNQHSADMGNALIRFSVDVDKDGKPLGSGESDYHCGNMIIGAATATANLKGPRFYPSMTSAKLEIPAVKNLLGQNVVPSVSYHGDYLDHGFDAPGIPSAPAGNAAHMVFSFKKQAVTGVAAAPTDIYGGLVSPATAPDGLSRKLGVLSGAADIASQFKTGALNPTALFPDDATLLGVIPLNKILAAVTDLAGGLDQVPRQLTETLPEGIVTTFTITRKTVSDLSPLFLPQDPGGDDQFKVETRVMVAKMGAKPEATTTAWLKAFKINLFGFIILHFDELSLKVNPGQKPDVTPKLNSSDGVEFGGALEFVNGLRDVIPMGGFSDGAGLDVAPTGITASYSLALPDIGLGALSLQNVSLGAGFDLPFTGEGPSARFNFAERHNPFNLTISLFGGGGFFLIAVGSEGVQELEASLEFGAQVSIDLGVASGGVYVKGGFYFHWIGTPKDKQLVQFEGYVELGGHLSVLGLITVSLTFHLGLTYEKTSTHTRLYGTATLTVEIDILFFSISQDVTVEKEFAGSDGDPSFLAFMPGDPVNNTSPAWSAYCDAFA